MVARLWNHKLLRLSVFAFALVAMGCFAPRAVAEGDLNKLDTSLKLIPEDAAFYSSMLRNREQFDAIANSNAWAKIMEMPAVQLGLSLYSMQMANPDSGPAQIDAALKNPEMLKILNLMGDMVSDEVFFYGDDNFIDFIKLVQIANGANNFGPLKALMSGKIQNAEMEKVRAGVLLSALAENAELIEVPNLIVGFKLKKTDLAKEQLIKLETIAGLVLEMNEQTKGHFKKTKVGDYEYLVLELDGKMIPWDEIPMDNLKSMEAEDGDLEKVVEQLKDAKLVIALGVRDNYLVLSIGESLKTLEKLGMGKRLIDREEIKPLAKYLDKKLTSVGYVSEAMNRQANSQENNVDQLEDMAEEVLPLAKVTDEQKERIAKDIKSLAKDIKTLIPDVGAAMSVSFLNDRGYEGYQYVWGEHKMLDGSKSLELLQHIGGNPILGIVARENAKSSVEQYDMFVKWIKTGYGYFQEFALPAMKEKEREQANKFLEKAVPLFVRMDKANREMLIPATADGQSALVLDRKLASKQFFDAMPAAEKELAMAEPAVVVGVSDAKLLKQGMAEYREIINGLIDAARQIEGSDIPKEIMIPEPKVTEGASGTIFSFVLPLEWGVDKKIVPNFGLSDKVGVFTASLDHTERLLKATPLSTEGSIIKADRPLAAAVWFNWAALVDAAAPWIDYAAAQDGGDNDEKQSVLDQVHTAVDVLKVIRSVSVEMYLENDVLVHHAQIEIRDVSK
jgi:hypothetical protein